MEQAQVKAAPPRPLLIYDGDCNFCKFWILRWQRSTRGQVDYLPSQDPQIKNRFPELPPERFDESVQFIETDGKVYDGAEAVFRSLTYAKLWAWGFWVYQNVPSVKPVTEWAYHFVSKHRPQFSFITRLFIGREGALPSYALLRWVFLRLMGIVYLSAFLSLGTQITGLMGRNGITPARELMNFARAQFESSGVGLERYYFLPTLCWFNAGDRCLQLLCGAGGVLSLLLIFDVAPALCLFLLWVIYLSLASVGNVFLSFQWDALLLEAGFLAIFFAPLRLFPRLATESPPSRVALWLLRWLLFRLMFESGLVKLSSGDMNWRNLSALNYHYETQPLPTWIGWYAHQLPGDIQKACVFLMFAIELAAPFLIFAPRRLRFFGCGLLIFLQVCIFVTGNYCFFNLLTIALCLLLLDDAALARLVPAKWRGRFLPKQAEVQSSVSAPPESPTHGPELKKIEVPPKPALSPKGRAWPAWMVGPVGVVYFLITLAQLTAMLGFYQTMPGWFISLSEWGAPLRSANTYGLFAVMTTSRLEIVIEGSNDGQTWLDYEFKYKPDDPKRRPAFIAPHQPRLDWQMWFAALGNYRQNPWLVSFCQRLLQGSPEVLSLLRRNPFPNAPPRFVRAQLYDYHFSNFQERRTQGVWWQREYQGEYLPPISLSDFQPQEKR